MSSYFTRDDRGEITLTDAGLAALDLLGLDMNQLSRISNEAATAAWFESRVQLLPEGPRKTFPFLIVPKPSKREKNKGCENMPVKKTIGGGGINDIAHAFGSDKAGGQNFHPTTKPIRLGNLITLAF